MCGIPLSTGISVEVSRKFTTDLMFPQWINEEEKYDEEDSKIV